MSDQVRAFMAVILSGVVIFAWQYFFAPAPHLPPQEKVNIESTVNPGQGVSKAVPAVAGSVPAVESAVLEQFQLNLTTGQEVQMTGAFQLLNVSKGKDDAHNLQDIAGSSTPMQFFLLRDGKDVPLNFHQQTGQANQWVGFDALQGVTLKLVAEENGKLHYELQSATPQKYRIHFKTHAKKTETGHPREFLLFSESVDRFEVMNDENGEKVAGWVGVDFDYHLFAVTFAEKQSVNYSMQVLNPDVSNKEERELLVKVSTNKAQSVMSGTIVVTKKNYDELIALGENLKLAVDFGFFAILAIPFLRCLQFFYHFIPNYGIAIILLTLILRIVTFPLQYKSFKGMKKMQEMQPELTKIREKYKDDPSKLNQETMALFKRAGHNPLSGCLPILLQLPIFIAFYKVLYSSVELVGAPFFGYITDLSVKDPFYILPVIMTVAMFLQQKMTPVSSPDPTQEKIMLFMPLVFGFIMKDLPAGLNLYIFVSTVFGIVQQLLVYRLMRKA